MCPSYKEFLGIDGEALEFAWNIFSGFRHCRFFKRSRMICESGTLNLKNSQPGSSSCQCSTTLMGERKEMMEFVCRLRKSPGIREEILARTLDVSRSWRRKEVV